MKARWLVLTAVWGASFACGTRGDAASGVSQTTLAAWLEASGVSSTSGADGLRWSCPGDEGVAAIARVEETRVRLATNGLYRISEAQGSRGVTMVLTQVATLAHDLDWGALSLDPETGEVVYTITLQVLDGLGADTLQVATEALCLGAETARPILSRAGNLDE